MNWEEAVQWLMTKPDQQDLVRACYYDSPRGEAADRYWRSAEWAAIQAFYPGQGCRRALDVGAGHGIASYALARDGWRVAAIEPDPSQLIGAGAIRQLASEESLPISVLRAVGEKMPFGDGVFQFIVARQALHHARDLHALCAEIFRVLKPGGVFMALREHVISRQSDLPRFFERHPLHRLYGGENAYRLSEYKSALKSTGFTLYKILRSFDTVINYAPWTEKTLYAETIRRIRKLPGGFIFIHRMLPGSTGFRRLLKCASFMDQRPGRLCSFICSKP